MNSPTLTSASSTLEKSGWPPTLPMKPISTSVNVGDHRGEREAHDEGHRELDEIALENEFLEALNHV